MAEFLVEALDGDGKTVVLTVHADGPSRAMKSVEHDGYRAIALRSDESLTGPVLERDEDKQLLETISAEDRVALSGASDPQMFLVFVRQTVRQLGWIYAGALGFAIYQLVVNGAVGWIVGVPLVLVASTVGLALFATKVGPHVEHVRYHGALAQGRWDEALRITDALARSLDEMQIAFMRAKVYAVTDRLDEAIALVRPFEGKQPDEAFFAQLSSVYDAARRFDATEQALHRALEAQPDNPTILLDLARTRLEHHRDAEGAKALLDRVDRSGVVSNLKFVFELLEGLIQLELGHATDARDLLEGVLAEVEQLHPRDIWLGFVSLTQMYLALAHEAAGEHEAALAQYAAASPMMRIARRDYLLERVESALGI